jgi:hypothetical protein
MHKNPRPWVAGRIKDLRNAISWRGGTAPRCSYSDMIRSAQIPPRPGIIAQLVKNFWCLSVGSPKNPNVKKKKTY